MAKRSVLRPQGPLEHYRSSPEFTNTTVPAGLLKDHSTKTGTWGKLVVFSGTVRFIADDSPVVVLNETQPGVIVPNLRHRIEVAGDTRFRVDFYRRAQP